MVAKLLVVAEVAGITAVVVAAVAMAVVGAVVVHADDIGIVVKPLPSLLHSGVVIVAVVVSAGCQRTTAPLAVSPVHL